MSAADAWAYRRTRRQRGANARPLPRTVDGFAAAHPAGRSFADLVPISSAWTEDRANFLERSSVSTSRRSLAREESSAKPGNRPGRRLLLRSRDSSLASLLHTVTASHPWGGRRSGDSWKFWEAGRRHRPPSPEYGSVGPWGRSSPTYGVGFDSEHPDAYRVL